MKRMYQTMFSVLMVIFFILPVRVHAAEGDTLTVFANDVNSLDIIINGDTTATGERAHKAYKLVSTDTTYLWMGAITANTDFSVIGVPGSNGRLPCLQPGILSDGSMPAFLFTLTGDGTTVTFKNFYIYGMTINSDWNWGKAFLLNGDDMRLYLDNIILDQNRGEAIAYTGTGCSFYITNCKFRNGVYPTNYFSSIGLTSDWPSSNGVDTLIMRYNTFFCIAGSACAPGVNQPANYIDFSHNNVIYNFVGVFRFLNSGEVHINDNIFYGVFAGAIPKGHWPAWYDPEVTGSVINFDTMSVADDSVWNFADYGKENFMWLTEAKRVVEVKNNCFFMPKVLTDYWAEWNTTHTGDDSLVTPDWMNDRTKNMFTDKEHWPGFVEENNYVNVDPGFGADFAKVLDSTDVENYDAGLLKYIRVLWGNTITNEFYGYKLEFPSSEYWVPTWPLPESEDMKYSNTSLVSTDGKQVGDPGWFNDGYTGVEDAPVQVAARFKLYEAYPNPFNPATTVKFSLAKAGNFSLKVYNVTGELVKVLADNVYKEAGEYTYSLNMNNFSSGVYFYTLIQGDQQLTKKLVLMK
jgi:hypothetical protein